MIARKTHVLNPEQRNLKHKRPERRQHVTDVVAQQMDKSGAAGTPTANTTHDDVTPMQEVDTHDDATAMQ